MQLDLLASEVGDERLEEGAMLLRGFALDRATDLLAGITSVSTGAPFRHLVTPGGRRMSVAMTNCGPLGWVSDARGYRYDARDPESGKPWPVMPLAFTELADAAARAAGFAGLMSDACLVNRYAPGARLTLHQDRDEADPGHPIVSVSLGLPATFLWGGRSRSDRPRRIRLHHGDVMVWGGPARHNFHGIDALGPGDHQQTGPFRFNLTFRCAR